MQAVLTITGSEYTINLNRPVSIGIPLNPFGSNPSCFHAEQPQAHPMDFNGFICSVEHGAPVNFYSMQLVPHGHGTHTECVGHISKQFEKVNKIFKNAFMRAELISIAPKVQGRDFIIDKEALEKQIRFNTKALIVRTLPNTEEKKYRNYSDRNPPYFSEAAMRYIVERNIEHLLIDLPSVDKEKDEGLVLNHKIFWNFSGDIELNKTITELIYVPNDVADGLYIMNLQIANMTLDAVPSNPILYHIQ